MLSLCKHAGEIVIEKQLLCTTDSCPLPRTRAKPLRDAFPPQCRAELRGPLPCPHRQVPPHPSRPDRRLSGGAACPWPDPAPEPPGKAPGGRHCSLQQAQSLPAGLRHRNHQPRQAPSPAPAHVGEREIAPSAPAEVAREEPERSDAPGRPLQEEQGADAHEHNVCRTAAPSGAHRPPASGSLQNASGTRGRNS